MTHEPIRKALAAGPTNSVWECDIRHGEMSRHAYVCAPNWGIVATVGLDRSLPHWDAPQRANAALIAACNPSAIAALLADLDRAHAEVQEQARLNGMGADREAALMAQVEALARERDQLKQQLAFLSNPNRAAKMGQGSLGDVGV